MGLHRATGQARVLLDGVHVYLGQHGTPEARAEYDRVIGLYLANGRRWPPPSASCGSVADLADRYVAWARAYYVKRGTPTNTARNAQRALELLYRSGIARCPAERFGPRDLKAYQSWLAKEPSGRWSRATINEYTRHVKQMFRWAVSEQIVRPEVYAALASVRSLPKGRGVAPDAPVPREGTPVMDVPLETVEAAASCSSPTIAAMIRLQLETGMRPSEVCAMRVGDVERHEIDGRTVGLYRVSPEHNKTEHHGHDRIVVLSPAALSILDGHLERDGPLAPGAYVFSPRRALDARNAERRASRKSKRWPSHQTTRRRQRRGQSEQKVRECYDRDSYRRAVTRACDAAGVDRFAPNRLRHTACTRIAHSTELLVAQMLLGHRDIKTTQRYTHTSVDRALRAAASMG